MKAVRDLICLAVLFGGVTACALAQSSVPSYQVSAASNGVVTIERAGKRSEYRPHFTIIRAETDPQLALSGFASTPGESLEGVNVENYPLAGWRRAGGNGRTDIVYEAGAVIDVRGTNSRALDDGGVAWTFESSPHFTLEAEVRPVVW